MEPIDWLYDSQGRIAVPLSRAAKKIAGKYRMTIRRDEMRGKVFEDSPHNFPRMARRLRVLDNPKRNVMVKWPSGAAKWNPATFRLVIVYRSENTGLPLAAVWKSRVTNAKLRYWENRARDYMRDSRLVNPRLFVLPMKERDPLTVARRQYLGSNPRRRRNPCGTYTQANPGGGSAMPWVLGGLALFMLYRSGGLTTVGLSPGTTTTPTTNVYAPYGYYPGTTVPRPAPTSPQASLATTATVVGIQTGTTALSTLLTNAIKGLFSSWGTSGSSTVTTDNTAAGTGTPTTDYNTDPNGLIVGGTVVNDAPVYGDDAAVLEAAGYLWDFDLNAWTYVGGDPVIQVAPDPMPAIQAP